MEDVLKWGPFALPPLSGWVLVMSHLVVQMFSVSGFQRALVVCWNHRRTCGSMKLLC